MIFFINLRRFGDKRLMKSTCCHYTMYAYCEQYDMQSKKGLTNSIFIFTFDQCGKSRQWFRAGHSQPSPKISNSYISKLEAPGNAVALLDNLAQWQCLLAKLSCLNFHPLWVVSRKRDPQLKVGENYSHLLNLIPNICKSWCLKLIYFPITVV